MKAKRYRIDREATDIRGHQSYYCLATTKEEAMEKFNKGDDTFLCEDFEVMNLSDIQLSDIYEESL